MRSLQVSFVTNSSTTVSVIVTKPFTSKNKIEYILNDVKQKAKHLTLKDLRSMKCYGMLYISESDNEQETFGSLRKTILSVIDSLLKGQVIMYVTGFESDDQDCLIYDAIHIIQELLGKAKDDVFIKESIDF